MEAVNWALLWPPGWWEQKEDESHGHRTEMTPLVDMSPGKLFSQDSEGAAAILPTVTEPALVSMAK